MNRGPYVSTASTGCTHSRFDNNAGITSSRGPPGPDTGPPLARRAGWDRSPYPSPCGLASFGLAESLFATPTATDTEMWSRFAIAASFDRRSSTRDVAAGNPGVVNSVDLLRGP